MMGLSSSRALFNASSPQGYQSTGLSLCWSKYGLVSFASLLATASHLPKRSLTANPNVSRIGLSGFGDSHASHGTNRLRQAQNSAEHIVYLPSHRPVGTDV